MAVFDSIVLSEENDKLLRRNFENVKVYKRTAKFGVKADKSPIFTLKIKNKYGDLEQYIIITKKEYVGCCLTDTILFEEKFFDSFEVENNDDKHCFVHRANLFNGALKNILENNIDFLKENNKFKNYEVIKFSEEEKENTFKSALTFAVLENKFSNLYRSFFHSLKKEGSYFSIMDFYETNDSFSKDVEREFKSLAKRIDKNSEEAFQDVYGFDIFEFREQILKYFFEERFTPMLSEGHHLFLLKNEKDILRSVGNE